MRSASGYLCCFALLGLVTPLSTLVRAAGEWEVEYVDTPRRFFYLTDRSLATDSQGNPHLAYGGASLYHAWWDGEALYHETADSGLFIGSYASIGIDALDRIHVSYYDQENGDLKYALKTSGGWACESVDSEGDVGVYTSTAVGADGWPHIAYHSHSEGSLRYASRDGDGWQFELVDAEGHVGHFASLALDSQGRAHVAYGVDGTGELRHAFRSDTGWQIEEPDTLASVSTLRLSLALAPSGDPHIAYHRGTGTSAGLGHAWRDSLGWHAETAIQGSTGYYSLAFDQSGGPHVAFFAPYALYHAYVDTTGWHYEIVFYSWPPVVYTGISIAYGSDPSPMISHVWGGDPAKLRLARRPSTTWQIWTIDTIDEVGSTSSVGFDSTGRTHIAYRDDAQRKVKYATRDALGWSAEVVDVYSGGSISLAVDGAGAPHIAYDWSENLRYAWLTGSGWSHEDIADMTSGYGSDQITLVLDGTGEPHLAYKAAAGGPHLFYACRDGGTWVIEDLGQFGGGQALAIDDLGHAHVVYAPLGGAPVRYGYRDENGWHIEEIDSCGPATPSLALSSDGSPHVACLTGSEVLYAWRTQSGWQCEAVCAESSATGLPVLRMDPLDFPHITWASVAGTNYAWKDCQGWHLELAPGCTHPSMALDPYWLPGVTGQVGGNLVLVRQTSPSALLARIDLVGDELTLRWSPVPGVAENWVYGTINQPYFQPGMAPGFEHRLAVLPSGMLEWVTSVGAGDPDSTGTYVVMAVDGAGQELLRSGAVGEVEYLADIPPSGVLDGPNTIRERSGLVSPHRQEHQ